MLVTLTIRNIGKLPLIKLPWNFIVQNLKLSNTFTQDKKMYKHDFQSDNYPAWMTNSYKQH